MRVFATIHGPLGGGGEFLHHALDYCHNAMIAALDAQCHAPIMKNPVVDLIAIDGSGNPRFKYNPTLGPITSANGF
jgi:hypothetical protein